MTSICLHYMFILNTHLIESSYLETRNLEPIKFMQTLFNINSNIQFVQEYYNLVPKLEDIILEINKDLVGSLDNLSTKEERYLFLKEVLNNVDIKVPKQFKTSENIGTVKGLFSLNSMYLYKGNYRLLL